MRAPSIAAQLYPHLTPYYEHGFPRHICLALAVVALDTMGHFVPEPVAMTLDRQFWVFRVNGGAFEWKCSDQTIRADPYAFGKWLKAHYCPPYPALEG